MLDSTGLKVFGEGEWKVRQHGVSRRRLWRKLHLGVDEATGMILTHKLTLSNVHDGPVLPKLLAQIDGPLEQVSAELPLKRHWSERQWRRIPRLCLPSGHSCQGCAPCHPSPEGGGAR